MDFLYLEPTENSPKVFLNPENGQLYIGGRSYMNNADTYLNLIIDWLRNYIRRPQPVTQLILEMENLDSRSHQMIIFLLEEINKYYLMGYKFEIVWKYNPDDVFLDEVGAELSELFDMPVKKLALT